MAKVPGTPAPQKTPENMTGPDEVPMELMQPPPPPLELVVHSAGIGVRKIDTPEGNLTLIQLMTPVGIMLSLKFDDDGIEYLKQQLAGGNIIVPPRALIVPS